MHRATTLQSVVGNSCQGAAAKLRRQHARSQRLQDTSSNTQGCANKVFRMLTWHASHTQNQQGITQAAKNPVVQQRRDVLYAGLAAAVLPVLLSASPAEASVTLTIRPKPQLKPYTLKAGYSVIVPDSWSLAYDRSADETSGTQAFFGNFRTFQTLSISKVVKPDGDLSPEQLLSSVLAEQRNNQSTYDFKLLSGDTPTQRMAPTADTTEGGGAAEDAYFDSEYSLAICRGLIQEGSGGSKRCIGPRDMDLEVVSRTFFQAFTVRQDNIYIIRGSSTTDEWPAVRAVAQEAVQSFRLPAALL